MKSRDNLFLVLTATFTLSSCSSSGSDGVTPPSLPTSSILGSINIAEVMMKKYVKVILALLLLLPLSINAKEESWYTYWSIGLSNNSYTDELDSALDTLESQPGVDRFEGAIDILGFYWPVQPKTILGFVVSGSFDLLSTPVGDIQINQYLYAASAMHFFGKETGDGIFLRGDFGIAKASIDADTTVGSFEATSDSGTGYLLGIGYGIPVSDESRLLLSVNISNKSIEGDDISAVSFNIGGLW